MELKQNRRKIESQTSCNLIAWTYNLRTEEKEKKRNRQPDRQIENKKLYEKERKVIKSKQNEDIERKYRKWER